MKKKLTKIIFLAGFLLVSFFISQNVFAYELEYVSPASFPENGIQVSSMGYDEDDEFYFSISVSPSAYFQYIGSAEEICVATNNGYAGLSPLLFLNEDHYIFLNTLEPVAGTYQADQYFNSDYWACILAGDTATFKAKWLYGNFNYGTSVQGSGKNGYITKNDIDTTAGQTNSVENYYSSGDYSPVVGYGGNGYYNSKVYLSINRFGTNYEPSMGSYFETIPTTFPFGASPPIINGVCGDANGSTFDWADYNDQDFCSSGTYTLKNSISSGSITWDCEGSGGGITESCSANYYINGECGTANGGYFSTSPEVSTLCSSESYLIFPSFVETSSGWTWICGGYYGGTQSYCSAYLTGTSYPSLPEEEDCSSYTIPDKWICEIKNIFNGAFLPSEAKLNELNIAINSFQTKAPFNYLSSASNILENVKNGISEDDLSITIMQNTSQVNLNDIEAFTSIIKTFFTILLMFAFLFWGINYIKHFFR